MRHYKYSVLALVLILACLLSACAPKTPAPAADNTSPAPVSSEPAPTEEKQLGGEIVVATWAGDPFESAWKAKAAEFEEKTGVTVVIDAVPWENLREKCVLELASNTGAYDVVYVHPSWFTEFAENGYLMPVSSYATEEEINAYASKLNVGKATFHDIVKELILPSRDPREKGTTAKLKEGVTDIKDLTVGMILEGTIRNVTGFGFFVDLGVEKDGLVHISEIANHFVDDPHKEGKPGDIVTVKVVEVDQKKGRISLTMKGVKQNRR